MKKIITLLIIACCFTVNAQCPLSVLAGYNFYSSTNDTIPVCTGATILYASGATTYTWMPGGVTTDSIIPSSSPTVYTLTGTTGTCTATYTFTTKINPPLNISLYDIFNSPICYGRYDSLRVIPGYANSSFSISRNSRL